MDQRAYLEQLWQAAYDPRVPRHMSYPSGSMLTMLEESIAKFPNRTALEFFGAKISYKKMGQLIETVAGNLYRMGLRPGDYIAMLLPTCPQHVIAFYAALRCGATVVEHNPLYTLTELNPVFADYPAKMAIVWDAAAENILALDEEVAPHTVISLNMIKGMPKIKQFALSLPIGKIRKLREQMSKPAPGTLNFEELLKPTFPAPRALTPDDDDIALLLYTSGTTGIPKGVPLSHKNLITSTAHSTTWVTCLEEGAEEFLVCLPFFHVFGCSLSMNAALSYGSTLHLIPKPDTKLLLDSIKKQVPTMIVAVPPVFENILKGAAERKISLEGIHVGISGAMPLKAELIDGWESATGGLLIEGYGLSETSPIVAGNPVNKNRKASSIGVPFPDTEVRLAGLDDLSVDVPMGEPGEILVKGPQVFAGYRNQPEENENAFYDGWFRTGDVAIADEDGYLRIVDRIKEVIITGGFNVYPTEVESAMRGKKGIVDVAVVGLTNDIGSEEVVAAVVTEDGTAPDLEKLRKWLKQRLTAYKVPRRVFVLAELPRNPMGKVLRRQVRKVLEGMDIGKRFEKVESEQQEQLRGFIPELQDRLAKLGPIWQEKLETLAPELAERLAAFEEWLHSAVAEVSPEIQARFERMDLARRIELLLDNLDPEHKWTWRDKSKDSGAGK